MPPKREKTDLLIIVPPARQRNIVWPPYGAMYVASALRQKGYSPNILNVDTERIANAEVIRRIRDINPKYIGYSSLVATSYKYIKDLSRTVKIAFPDTIQILGGGLSAAAGVVLRHTPIDIVVYGEGEATAIELLECLDKNADIDSVRGIYYKKDGSSIFTGRRPLIRNIDSLAYPEFNLIDMNNYLTDGVEFIRRFSDKILNARIMDPKRKRQMINILTNRGCIGGCSFCARQDVGLRVHSIEYVFDFIEYCMEHFNAGFFSFGDECFAPNKERNRAFIEEYKKRRLDFIFRILGMRVDTIDRDIIRAYKDIGCWMIGYGFESGSQKMLNIIDKRVTVEQNRAVARWTKEAGIHTTPQLILGMPGETDDTIQETIEFLKSLDFDFKEYKCTHALPIPGSQLYEYAKLTEAIQDEDRYLSSLGDIEGTSAFHVNLTDMEDDVVAKWPGKLERELDDHYIYSKYRIGHPLLRRILLTVELIKLHIKSNDLIAVGLRKFKIILYRLLHMEKNKLVIEKRYARFRKRKNIRFEEFLKEQNCSTLNRNISLKKINERLLREMEIKGSL
jgi:anaerobic magnesium-protoporphyrin IX monomethyl ester cyclase